MTAYILRIYKEIRVEFFDLGSRKGWEISYKEPQFLDSRFLQMEGSNSSRTNCISPQINLYLVKVSKICSVLAVGNPTLSGRAGEEEDAKFLLASFLNFLPILGAISKIKEKKNQQ